MTELAGLPKRPEFIIAGICTECGFEDDAAAFEFISIWPAPNRLKCPRCGKGALEIPYQSLALRGTIITTPGHYPQYACDNCGTSSKWGPMYVNGKAHNWCGTCALAVVAYHRECERTFERPEFSMFLAALAGAREKVRQRRVIIPGA